jgi:quercetin dioxygenase-like cupin family protein
MSMTDVGQSFLDAMSDKEQIETLSAEVRPLGELLQYQDGSIVSRVLLKNKGGTVTLFAFDRGEGLSEHTAPFEALVFVVDGAAEVEIAAKVYRVRSGETITLPANIPHAVRAATRFKMLLTMIRT